MTFYKNSKDDQATLAVIFFVCCVAGGFLSWISKSHFEAAAFNRLTGKKVSTWDAMFVDLRVQEPVK